MAYLRTSNSTPAARIGVLGVVLSLLLAWTPCAGAQPLTKGPQERSFGSLAHSTAPRHIPTLEQLAKKWHRTLRRRLDGLTDESVKTRRSFLGKLLETLAHQKKLSKGARYGERNGQQALDVANFLEDQIVREVQKSRGAWAVAALIEQVLDWRGKESQRSMALWILSQAKHADASTLLLLVANSESGELRRQALRAMAHWPREELDMHLCRGFAKHAEDRNWQDLIGHRVGAHGPLSTRAGSLLIPTLRLMTISEDWRVAGQALWIAKGLAKERRVEFLVGSIASVAAGVKSGTVRWRILADISRELREISGRSFGLDPRPWQAWYQRVLAGELELDARDGEKPRTVAGFFGLGRVSDHVTFVLDGSGSMESQWGTGGKTTYEEAINQLTGYLDNMGEGMYFRVVLFADDAKVMVPLQKVEEGTSAKVAATMLKRLPNGATALGAGVELALQRNKRGAKRNKDSESDAFIVLCDGATIEGAVWARNLIASEDFPLGLRLHCVQLGRSRAGAMKALAEGTGGRFVRVLP